MKFDQRWLQRAEVVTIGAVIVIVLLAWIISRLAG
jgi:hypothetical protein